VIHVIFDRVVARADMPRSIGRMDMPVTLDRRDDAPQPGSPIAAIPVGSHAISIRPFRTASIRKHDRGGQPRFPL